MLRATPATPWPPLKPWPNPDPDPDPDPNSNSKANLDPNPSLNLTATLRRAAEKKAEELAARWGGKTPKIFPGEITEAP